MYSSVISSHFGKLTIATVVMIVAAGKVYAEETTMPGPHMNGMHSFHSMLPEGCRPEGHAGKHEGSPPTREEMMKKMADEFGLTGQQQQDLQILVTDYAQRLQEIAKLMRTSGEKLATTEPGDPYYWPLAQEVSASAAASVGETVILLSELREKIYQVLTAEQRAAFKRKIEERKAQCKPPVEAEQPAG